MALILNILKYKWIIKMIFYWSAYKKIIFTLKFILIIYFLSGLCY